MRLESRLHFASLYSALYFLRPLLSLGLRHRGVVSFSTHGDSFAHRAITRTYGRSWCTHVSLRPPTHVQARARPDFQEEERRRRPLTIRLRAPLILEWIREEQDSRRSPEWHWRREKGPESSCRESASNLLYLDWQELWEKCTSWSRDDTSMKIKRECL